MEFAYGWNPKLEAQHANRVSAFPSLAVPSDEKLVTVDPRPVIPCSYQSFRPSCEGHALGKTLEFLNVMKTGKHIPLSRRYAWLITKRVDGTLNDGNEGASINGGMLAAKADGICREETFPYWLDSERYSPEIPAAASAEGKLHILKTGTPLGTADQAARFVCSGQGGFMFGVQWTESLAQCNGVITHPGYGAVLGGHALCCLGFLAESKRFLMWNSHGEGWGSKGTAEVAWDVMDNWIRYSPYGVRGLSDLNAFERRKFTFRGVVS